MENRESILERIDKLNEDIRNNEIKKKRLEEEFKILRSKNEYKHYIGKYLIYKEYLDDSITYMKVKDVHCYERQDIHSNSIDFVGNGFCIKNGSVDIHEEVNIRIDSDGCRVDQYFDEITEDEYNSVLKNVVRDIIFKSSESLMDKYYIGKCIMFKNGLGIYYIKVSNIIPFNDFVTNTRKVLFYGCGFINYEDIYLKIESDRISVDEKSCSEITIISEDEYNMLYKQVK